MHYTHILWDFNGTLFDDVQCGIDSVNELLIARGISPIPCRAYYQKVFGFPIKSYYERLGFDFEKEPYEDLAVEWVKLYNKHSLSAPLVPGVHEVLSAIKETGIPQTVLSATEKDMLHRQLRELAIIDYFDEILGLDNIYAGSKTHLGVEWMNRIRPERALLIGDTTHDYETAKQMGIDCILYSGGHMSRDTLAACGCKIIENLMEAMEIINKK